MNYVSLEETMRAEASRLLGGCWTRNANNQVYAVKLRQLMYLFSAAGDYEMHQWIESVWKEQYNEYKASGGRAKWIQL